MGITSINLSGLPFLGSCDSTRAQMASKQMAQALTHTNCDIPYVISDEYRYVSEYSKLGILLAKDDGKVVFRNEDLIIIYYYNLDKIIEYQISTLKQTTAAYASKLRYCLNEGDDFKKDDVIYSFDCFRCAVPSFGYNTFTGYFSFFGFE